MAIGIGEERFMTTLTNVQLHPLEKLLSFSEKDIDALIEQVLGAQQQVNEQHRDCTTELQAYLQDAVGAEERSHTSKWPT